MQILVDGTEHVVFLQRWFDTGSFSGLRGVLFRYWTRLILYWDLVIANLSLKDYHWFDPESKMIQRRLKSLGKFSLTMDEIESSTLYSTYLRLGVHSLAII